jgi:hypothetical protein
MDRIVATAAELRHLPARNLPVLGILVSPSVRRRTKAQRNLTPGEAGVNT